MEVDFEKGSRARRISRIPAYCTYILTNKDGHCKRAEGVTVRALARRLGIHPNTLTRYLKEAGA